jgi:hypothetical protein
MAFKVPHPVLGTIMATVNTLVTGSLSQRPAESSQSEKLGRSLLRLRLPIRVIATTSAGDKMEQITSTELVGPGGATFNSPCLLQPSQELHLTFGTKQVLARLVGQIGIYERSHTYAMSFLQYDPRFWGVSFPSQALASQSLSMECCRCGCIVTHTLNEIESLVLRVARQIPRLCPSCNEIQHCQFVELAVPCIEDVEVERFGQNDVTHANSIFERDPHLVPLASLQDAELFRPPERGERRRHKRIRLPNAKGCIELPDKGRDIVEVVNVSKSGACIRSKNLYPLGTWIRIAVPYTIGALNIFQSGRIVRLVDVDSRREYGVEYIQLM